MRSAAMARGQGQSLCMFISSPGPHSQDSSYSGKHEGQPVLSLSSKKVRTAHKTPAEWQIIATMDRSGRRNAYWRTLRFKAYRKYGLLGLMMFLVSLKRGVILYPSGSHL